MKRSILVRLVVAITITALPAWVGASVPTLQAIPLTPASPGAVGDDLPQDVRARSMASGDFDEDGVPDLVISYSGGAQRLLALYRGNHDSIFPFSAAARERMREGSFHGAPFHPSPATFPTLAAFDFLAAGDFDADGHLDLVGATVGQTFLEVYRGDGQRDLTQVDSVDLGGALTALQAGEVNRRDGLADLVVGIRSGTESELLVFEGPEGALTGSPERFNLPTDATSIALGNLDGLFGLDIAVAAGSELVLIHGRDRKLSLDRIKRGSVAPALVDRFATGATIEALAFGNFDLDAAGKRELAVFSNTGRVEIFQGETRWIAGASQPTTSWVLKSQTYTGAGAAAGSRPQLVPVHFGDGVGVAMAGIDLESLAVVGARDQTSTMTEIETGSGIAALLPMRLNPDALTDLVMISEGGRDALVMITAPEATITVDSNADNATGGDGNCTLREAINNANAGSDTTSGDCTAGSAGADTIEFGIAGGSAQTITMADFLPEITDPVTINGNTQCGSPPCIELDGSAVPDPAPDDGNGIKITGGSSTIRGFSMTGWPDDALETSGLVGGNLFEGNYFGLQLDGSTADGNQNNCAQLFSPDNTFGGTTAAARNLAASSIAGGGVQIVNFDPGTLITDASGNTVTGNYVGTNSAGTLARGNTQAGVYVFEGSDNTIGGTAAGAENLISASTSGPGVLIRQNDLAGFVAENNLVQGNLIGTDVNGTGALGNGGDGAWIWFTSNNTIGGTTAAARNIISASGRFGVLVTNDSTGLPVTENNLVQGNYIGVDINGTGDLGNTNVGVVVSASDDNTVGGTSAGAGNVVSGNSAVGILVGTFDTIVADGNSVQGNFIGTNAAGTTAIANDSTGVYLNGATNTLVGGTEAGAKNLISGNGFHGIHVQNSSNNNTIQGNFIGTNLAGSAALANVQTGIWIDNNSSGNLIGGPGSGPTAAPEGGSISPPGNLISGNMVDGIQIYSGLPQNRVQGNYIGTNAAGTTAIANIRGIFSWFDGCFTLGGTGAGEGNLISGNTEYGVFPGDPNSGCTIQGNYIGVNSAGTAAIPNGLQGIFLKGANHLVGGTTVGARNVISGNGRDGILLSDEITTSNTISGNYIGTDVTGTQAVPNNFSGILAIFDTHGNTIGGTDPGAGNLISGHGGSAIVFGDTNGGGGVRNNIVAGNLLGTTANGLAALPNGGGVFIGTFSLDNTIGGDTTAARNVISGNSGTGINIGSSPGNVIKNNYIGVGIDGTTALGNTGQGINISSAAGNQIGDVGAGNRIWWNGNGVHLQLANANNNLIVGNDIQNSTNAGVVLLANAGTGNTISRNTIHGSGGLGIDLGADGITANDDLDPDPGTNNLQNFPVLTVVTSGSTNVTGTLNSLASTLFTVEFFSSSTCDGSGYGEGETYLGSVQVTTNGSGTGNISTILGATASVGDWVTATATAPDGSTSEFSECVEVFDDSYIFGGDFDDGTTDAWSATMN